MTKKLSDPAEIVAAFTALREEIGPRAQVFPSVGVPSAHWVNNRKPLSCGVYPAGMSGDSRDQYFSVEADGWDELLALVRATWAERSDTYAAEKVKAMAAAIIRTTYETGGCSDAQLRAEFEAEDVKRFAARACELANEMADKGPFTVTVAAGANDEAA